MRELTYCLDLFTGWIFVSRISKFLNSRVINIKKITCGNSNSKIQKIWALRSVFKSRPRKFFHPGPKTICPNTFVVSFSCRLSVTNIGTTVCVFDCTRVFTNFQVRNERQSKARVRFQLRQNIKTGRCLTYYEVLFKRKISIFCLSIYANFVSFVP